MREGDFMAFHFVRKAKETDIDVTAGIEKCCFPVEEAAAKEQIAERIRYFGSHFYVIEYAGIAVGFIGGMITDEMYQNVSLHNEDGKWQTVFSLAVTSGFRKKGFAVILLNELIKVSKEEGRQGVILTCKKHLIPYYEKFGFQNMGVSGSVHGGAVWYDMKLIFKKNTEE